MNAAAPTLGQATAAEPRRHPRVPRAIGGACAEVAYRLDADPEVIRVFLFLAGWFVPRLWLGYLAAVLLIPQRGRRLPGWANLVGGLRFGLLYLVLWGLVGGTDTNFHDPAVWVGRYGIALAVFVGLVAGSRERETDAADRSLALASLAVLGLGTLILAGMWLIDGVRWELVAELAVGALGVALLVLGERARPFVTPTLVAGALVLVLAASGARLEGGLGTLRARPAAASGLASSYCRAAGRVELDLSALANGGRAASTSASVGIGTLEIVIPANADVRLLARVGRGTIQTESSWSSGLGLSRDLRGYPQVWPDRSRAGDSRSAELAWMRAHPGIRLTIRASVGSGTLIVRRAGGFQGLGGQI